VREWAGNGKTLIALAVDGEQELEAWERKLTEGEIRYATFVEPDIGGQRTALATVPPDGRIFKNLSLL
jgi:hypothetical protein